MPTRLLAKPDLSDLCPLKLRQQLRYDPESGAVDLLLPKMRVLRWETTRQPPKVIIDGKRYRLADVLWLYVKWVAPRARVVTANANHNDMRLSNLKENVEARTALITQEQLKAVLHYDPDNGVFTRLVDAPRIASRIKSHGTKAGDRAGSVNTRRGGKPRGRYISLFERHYGEHRLAWLYMTGEWPAKSIDHKNCDPCDNRWCNLRQAVHAQNIKNRGKPRNNRSGFKGVSWHKGAQKWIAQIACDGENHYLGLYINKEEAAHVYRQAELRLFGEFARVA